MHIQSNGGMIMTGAKPKY